jgi:hypothetical protein
LDGPSAVHAHARQFRLPLRGAHALHGLRDLRLHHEGDDARAELAVGRVRGRRQRLGDFGPGLQRARERGAGCWSGLVRAPLLASSCGGTRLALPAAQAAPGDASRRPRRGFGLDAPVAQLLGKGLAPAVQVFLAGVQAFAVSPLRANADVHVRIRLVRVQHHDVAMVRQFGLGELARRLAHHASIGAGRHRQHDVEGLASFADFGYACTA